MKSNIRTCREIKEAKKKKKKREQEKRPCQKSRKMYSRELSHNYQSESALNG
jgi:hypothetical protein